MKGDAVEICFFCSDLHDGAVRAMNLLRRVDLPIVSLAADPSDGRYRIRLVVETRDSELVQRVARQIGQMVDIDQVETKTGDRRAA